MLVLFCQSLFFMLMLQVTLYHILKLFHQGADVALSRKTLVTEFYEEVVFQDPTQYMQHLLTNVPPLPIMGTYKHETDCAYFIYRFSK